MRRLTSVSALLLTLLIPPTVRAGLHYSGETYNQLPSQRRGFLLDQRQLRGIAVKGTSKNPASPARLHYEQEAAKLAKLAKERDLTADEAADLGALYIRMNDVGRALEVLRPAQRAHPTHYRLAANLGTAWHLNGDYNQAMALLQLAVKLAPGKYQKAEELHLKLVRLRAASQKGHKHSTISLAFSSSAPAGNSSRASSRWSSARKCRATRRRSCNCWRYGCRTTAGCYGSSRNWPTPTATWRRRRRSWTVASPSSACARRN